MPLRKSLLLTATVVLAVAAGCARDTASRSPDVILIVVDTLRADRLGCYGYGEGTSPNIDRLAADSLVFERAYAHSSDTLLSCSAMMSGYLPHETRMLGRHDLPREVPTLAETLQSNGYETAAVVSNYVLREGQGFEQGFEIFDSRMQQAELVRRWPERIAEFTTDRAIEILEQERERPLFLWVHYQDPHGPYTPPAEHVRPHDPDPSRSVRLNAGVSGRGGIPMYQRIEDNDDPEFYRARYDGEIRYTDTQLARLIETLEKNGAYDDAVIVFTADHGEGLGEHNYFFAHGEQLYDELIRVPLAIRWGDRYRGRRQDPVQLVDLVPTIHAMLGLPLAATFRGTDILAGPSKGRAILSVVQSPLLNNDTRSSLVKEDVKLIYTPRFRAVQLFDLAEDPGEENSVAADPANETLFRQLLKEINDIESENRLGFEPQDAPLAPTEEELEKLRSLGYVR